MDAGGRSGKDTRCELRCSWNEAIQPVLLPPNASIVEYKRSTIFQVTLCTVQF